MQLQVLSSGIPTRDGRATILTSAHVSGDQIDFERLESMTKKEKNLLPVHSSSMYHSYNSNLAAVLRSNDGVDRGFVRLIPLLYDLNRRDLGLPNDIGSIMEIGSAVVDRDLRGNRYSEDLLTVLIRQLGAQDKTLLLSTSKNAKFISAIRRVSLEEGMENYRIISHNEFPLIAPFTCTCTPPNGTGFGVCSDCTYRVNIGDQALKEYNRTDFGYFEHIGTKCFMYISDLELAKSMEQKISNSIKNVIRSDNKLEIQSALVSRLRKTMHYS